MRHHDPDDVLADRDPSPPDAYTFDLDTAVPDPCPPVNPNRDVAAGLRELADFLDAHPEMESLYPPTFNAYASLADIARRGYGPLEKATCGDWFVLRKMFGVIQLDFNQPREQVCERVQVGTRIVPASPEREEPVFEWKCPESLLRGVPERLPIDPHEDLDDDFELDPDK